jgi:hypothetical protein
MSLILLLQRAIGDAVIFAVAQWSRLSLAYPDLPLVQGTVGLKITCSRLFSSLLLPAAVRESRYTIRVV